MEDLKKTFAGKLLNIKAIKLQPNDPLHGQVGGNLLFIATIVKLYLTTMCARL